MPTSSNAYTFAYAAAMVVVVAFLLSFVSSSLRAKQDANVKLDTKKQILYSLNVETADADAYFTANVKDMILKGDTIVEYKGEFVTNYEAESKDKKDKDDKVIKEGRLHVFVCNLNGQTKYVIPVYGAGLWGAIWGYVALNDDKNTVFGTYFSHASETPGLGAEIQSVKFQKQFEGKLVGDSTSVKISVVKNGKVEDAKYEVDGISGGTITSTGVDAMLKNCLGNYTKFLKR
ncbi:MAG: NADH:ubiquinone reductase (Na(+)-transporting) subunit C [Salinivirgaceae bacterium]|nr:NADH:ubiquinone reductase (Na(+)-transporting) subunit C [Salinivirgaceae bacterium]